MDRKLLINCTHGIGAAAAAGHEPHRSNRSTKAATSWPKCCGSSERLALSDSIQRLAISFDTA